MIKVGIAGIDNFLEFNTGILREAEHICQNFRLWKAHFLCVYPSGSN